jgi:hypothetical protein
MAHPVLHGARVKAGAQTTDHIEEMAGSVLRQAASLIGDCISGSADD